MIFDRVRIFVPLNVVHQFKQSYVARISTIRRWLESINFLSSLFPLLGSVSWMLFAIISGDSYGNVCGSFLQKSRRNAIRWDVPNSVASNHLSPRSH